MSGKDPNEVDETNVRTAARRGRPSPPEPVCPVCLSARTAVLLAVEGRDYWRCRNCEARFLDPAQLPARAAERAYYIRHRNDVGDPGYRRFLSKLALPLLARLETPSAGLDYGCGPGPALAAMFREAGHEVALYDPFFAPDPRVLEDVYDFVVCSETAEHFHRPADEFRRLHRLVRPGGWLGVMTCFQTDDARFAAWHYRRDPTHVVFYRESTFRHLAGSWGWSFDTPVKDVVLMQRPGPGNGQE